MTPPKHHVRHIHRIDGRVGVRGECVSVRIPTGQMTPTKARALATMLNHCADRAEGSA